MRLIAMSNLKAFWETHPKTKASLERWVSIVEEAAWTTTGDVQAAFTTAKVLNADRVRFEVSGGGYRLIASFKFKNQLVWVKFIGSRADYDKIDALTVSMF